MKRFILCFDSHRDDGLVWAVKQGNQWRVSRAVDVRVPLETVYKGKEARQPRAYLVGSGTVSGDEQRLTIHW